MESGCIGSDSFYYGGKVMATNTGKMKEELAGKAEVSRKPGKLTKGMDIAEMIKVMEPEIKRALPEVLTPERFTRMALSALNTTPNEFLSSTYECGTVGIRAKHTIRTGLFNSI